MTRGTRRRAGRFAGGLLAIAGFVAGVFWFAFTSALDQLEERGHADLALGAAQLTGQLQRFRELAVLLSDHPTLVPLVLGSGLPEGAHRLLLEMADKTGSQAILLADASGRVVATSFSGPLSIAAEPAFRRAMNGALGSDHVVEDDRGRRIFSFAAPVFRPGSAPVGAVVVRVDIDTLEANWPTDPSAIFFTDDDGVVFVSNRSELTLTRRYAAPDSEGGDDRAPFPKHRVRTVRHHELWSLDGGRFLPGYALHLTRPLPVVGMTAEILLDLAPAFDIALLQAAVAAALCLAFGAFLFRAVDRLRYEAEANVVLEARVAERTEELSAANAELLHEIGERREAEAALKRAQAELVQAGKLSALGQMSAGISHELNQPLMAIQGFAENGALLIERGKTEAAAENLGRIAELARRMGRIIRNLRAFARQEKAEVTDVDLVAVVDAALEIAGPKAARAGVALDWARPESPIMVRGGEVRLQQVVMNLVSNAVDAMEGGENCRIALAVAAGAPVRLTVRDTGPGIAEPERIFDPFYSTKAVGASEGMGLGLSISYGLVQSFGGVIRGRNHPGGGAEFTVELTPADAKERAA